MKRKLGIGAECLGDSPKNLELIKKAGFEAIHTGSYTLEKVEKYKTAATELKLDYDFIHAPFFNINSMWSDGEEYAGIFEAIKESIVSASAFEVPTVCIHVSSGWTPPAISDIGLERFDEIVDLGLAKGVRVAIENQRLPEYLAFFMARYQSTSNVGFCYDVGHEKCFTEGTDLLSLYGDRLLCTHIHDNFGSSEDRSAKTDLHLLPFDGNIDYRPMMVSLDSCEYKGSLMLEVFKRNPFKDYARLSDERYLEQAYHSLVTMSNLISTTVDCRKT